MIDDILAELEDSFDKAKAALDRELSKLRTGRASASLLDSIRVDYYGSPTPVNQVATVKIPEPRMITLTPWEKSMLKPLERAILASNLDVTPQSDGTLIRLAFPALTGEVRTKIAKQARRLGEDAKIAIRSARKDANDMLKVLQKDGEISEDQMHTHMSTVQAKVDSVNKDVDTIVSKKEDEINEI